MAWRLIMVTQRLATRLGDLRYRRCGRKLGAEKRCDITSPESIAAERITAVGDASKNSGSKRVDLY